MQTSKQYIYIRSHAVRLPREFQFKSGEVLNQKNGVTVILVPHDRLWDVLLHGLESFSPDFMESGRDQGNHERRDDI